MAKQEALGLTLLDVLTNSFAAAMLLMAVVSVTVGPGGPSERPLDGEDGKDDLRTVELKKPDRKKEKPDPNVLTALFRLKGPDAATARLVLDCPAAARDSFSLRKGLYRAGEWSLIRRGQIDAEWAVRLSGGAAVDSALALVTLGTAPTVFEKKAMHGGELLRVDDRGDQTRDFYFCGERAQ